MREDCRPCLGTGQNFSAKSNAKWPDRCPTCFGAGWIDPTISCKCGRAGNHYSRECATWFCGRLSCEPKKPVPPTPVKKDAWAHHLPAHYRGVPIINPHNMVTRPRATHQVTLAGITWEEVDNDQSYNGG